MEGNLILQIILIFLPVLAVVAIFAVGFSWYIARTSMVPTRTPKTKTPQDFEMKFEEFSVQRDGLKLRGWFIPAPDKSHVKNGKAPTLILTHGWGRSAEQMLPHAEYLHQAGFHLSLFDMRGHGDSDAVEYVTMKEILEDLGAIIDYTLTRSEVDPNSLGLFGHSMGAAASILKASQDNRVKAVASSSGFADFGDLTTQMLRWRKLPVFPFRLLVQKFWEKHSGIKLSQVNPVEQIGNISVPILLLHGDRDQVVTPDQLGKLFTNTNSAEKHMVKGKNHSDLFDDPMYREKVVAFFNTTLKNCKN
jgi:alpha-beta hydrolase superfamily lysophospholipase